MTRKSLLAVVALCVIFVNVNQSIAGQALAVHNSDVPTHGIQDLRLEQVWRIDPEDERFFMGIINRAVADSQGNVYLLDWQQSLVHAVDMEGYPLDSGVLSGPGEGPGETHHPNSLMFTAEDELALIQSAGSGQASRIVRIGTDGVPRGQMDFHVGILNAKFGGGYFVIAGFRHRGTNFLARFDAEGSRKMRYWTSDFTVNMTEINIQFFHFDAFTVDGQGKVYVAPEWSRYFIEVYGPDDKILMTISRDYELRRREKADMRRGMKRIIGRETIEELPYPRQQYLKEMNVEVVVEKYDRAILSLALQRSGELWVLTSRGVQDQDPGVMCTYDIFDQHGVFDRQVRLLGEYSADNCRFFLTADQRIIVIQDSGELNTSGAQIISYHNLTP